MRHAFVRHQAQEAEMRARLMVGGNKSALALATHDEVLGRQFVDGLAHRTLADLETPCQLDFAGNQLARLPFARLQALRNERLDLLVQGAEGGRRAGNGHRRRSGIAAGHYGDWRAGRYGAGRGRGARGRTDRPACSSGIVGQIGRGGIHSPTFQHKSLPASSKTLVVICLI